MPLRVLLHVTTRLWVDSMCSHHLE